MLGNILQPSTTARYLQTVFARMRFPVGFQSKWVRWFRSIAKSWTNFYFFCDRSPSSSYQLLENTHAQIKMPSQKVERATYSAEWKSSLRMFTLRCVDRLVCTQILNVRSLLYLFFLVVFWISRYVELLYCVIFRYCFKKIICWSNFFEPPPPSPIYYIDGILYARFFYKKQVYMKDEAQIRQKLGKQLRSTGRLSFKCKLEESVFARKNLILTGNKIQTTPVSQMFLAKTSISRLIFALLL